MSRRRAALIWGGVGITAASLWYSLRDVDFGILWNALAGARWGWAIPLLLLYGLHFWLKALRWAMLLEPLRTVEPRILVPPMMMGYLANNILPARLGEFVRALAGARRTGLRGAQVLSTLLLERLFDVLAVLAVFAFVSTGAGPDSPLTSIGKAAGATVAIVFLGFLLAARWPSYLLRWADRIPQTKGGRALREHVALALEGLRAIERPGLLVGVVATSIAQWLLIALSIECGLRAVGLDLSFSAACIVLAGTVLAVSLPSSPGFFGPVQVAFLLALQPFGVSESVAIAASLFHHVLTWIAITVAGLVLLRVGGNRLADLKRHADLAEDATGGGSDRG